MALAYIGIGSNLGNREGNCKRAIELIIKRGIKVTNQSSMIETEPWGIREQPKFINMAIEVETDLSPTELLSVLKDIESGMGRVRGMRWGPRIIDLDILLYDDLIIKTPELEIPHQGTFDRFHVLKPLSEIAPQKTHPVLKKCIKELLYLRPTS
ncbi:MAG: 2-amino-4-hydroxy-6-hydroxymethyldihydropteridine diphosphokinase [Thermodesulfovibrionia bacterium]